MKIKMNIRKYIINNGKETKTDKECEDDYIIKCAGTFGVWHLLICCTISLTRITALWNILSILYLTPNTEFVCVKFNDNIAKEVTNSTCYENCIKYKYYETIFEKSLISEFDLICDRAWLASFTQVAMVFGFFNGIVVSGWFSDRCGRKKALILATLTNVIFMLIIPFSTNYWFFTCFRFFIGFSSGGILSISIVYILEIVGPQYREAVVNTALLPDFTSQLLAPLFAYFTSTWNQFLFAYGVASLVIFLLLIPLPESPRWLMTNGKVEEVVAVMTKAAIVNKRSIVGIKENVIKTVEELRSNEKKTPKFVYLDFFRKKRLTRITIGVAVLWFVTGLCFYGIMQYVTLLGSNLYIVATVMGISQAPTTFVAYALSKTFGRKIPAILSFITIGLSMTILMFIVDNSLYSTILGIFGTAAANVSFSILYLYTPELYPTVIRNMGFSFTSSASKLGAIIAPFIANTKPQWIASLIFAVCPFIAAGFCLMVPETKGKKLQDTFDE